MHHTKYKNIYRRIKTYTDCCGVQFISFNTAHEKFLVLFLYEFDLLQIILNMLHSSSVCRNYYVSAAKIVNPSNQIHSGPRWFTEPERLLQHKILYFTLGVDTLPLRRVGIIRAERQRMRMAPATALNSSTDPTGYRRSRITQLNLWYKRCMYQEWWLEHLYTRFAWGRCGYYPTGGGKISGVYERGVWGYDRLSIDRYSREPLPAQAREIYERRK